MKWILVTVAAFGLVGCLSDPNPCLQQQPPASPKAVAAPPPPARKSCNLLIKPGKYWEFEPKSVKEQFYCEGDGRALAEVTYANPSPTETWSVCSGMNGNCYGEFIDRKSAEDKARQVALSLVK